MHRGVPYHYPLVYLDTIIFQTRGNSAGLHSAKDIVDLSSVLIVSLIYMGLTLQNTSYINSLGGCVLQKWNEIYSG